jgi:hypothetical protein
MTAREARRAAGNRITRKQRRKTAHADNLNRAAANAMARAEKAAAAAKTLSEAAE